jgi:glycosyltransferase involved in cell wall biosynthesis
MKYIGVFLGMQPTSGGAFQYSESILEALAALPKERYRVVALYAHLAWEPTLERYPFKAIRPKGAKYGHLLSKLIRETLLPGWACRLISDAINPIAWAMRKEKCDLWIYPGHDALNYQVRVPSLVSVHDLMHVYYPNLPETSKFGRRLMRDVAMYNEIAWAKGHLVDSEIGKQHLEVFCGKRHHSPIFPLRFIAAYQHTDAPLNADFLSRYSIPEKYIFYPAQFWSHKNHLRLIEAVASLTSTHPDLHLVLCGSNKGEYERVKARIAELGITNNVSMLGFIPEKDLPEFYRRARALVMPTLFGPTNIPPLEAFALGCPVAMSGIFAMPEQGKDAALYFDPFSIAEIADRIAKLWSDDSLCAELRAKGFVRTADWGQPQFNARLLEILDTLLPAKNRD